KANMRATVHRPQHADVVMSRIRDEAGRITGLRLVLGLFAAGAYNRNPRSIPLLRAKVLRILAAALEAQPNGQTAIRAEITEQDKHRAYVKRLHFAGDGWELTSKTIDGTYPDDTRVMPPLADDITATLSYAALNRFPTTACDRALKIDPEAGIMSMRMVDQEGDFAVPVPVQGKGKAFGVNIHYLKDFARPAGIIRLQSGKPGDPLYCLTDDPNLQQVVMPMRI
ncbi:MAG: hypothetical protein ACK4NH_11565, partial [Gemmobacter sp.]